jgi:hypothetical protein
VTALAGQVQVHSAKIIVEQTAAVATKIYIPLANSTYTLEHASDTGSNGQVISTTSAPPTGITYTMCKMVGGEIAETFLLNQTPVLTTIQLEHIRSYFLSRYGFSFTN